MLQFALFRVLVWSGLLCLTCSCPSTGIRLSKAAQTVARLGEPDGHGRILPASEADTWIATPPFGLSTRNSVMLPVTARFSRMQVNVESLAEEGDTLTRVVGSTWALQTDFFAYRHSRPQDPLLQRDGEHRQECCHTATLGLGSHHQICLVLFLPGRRGDPHPLHQRIAAARSSRRPSAENTPLHPAPRPTTWQPDANPNSFLLSAAEAP